MEKQTRAETNYSPPKFGFSGFTKAQKELFQSYVDSQESFGKENSQTLRNLTIAATNRGYSHLTRAEKVQEILGKEGLNFNKAEREYVTELLGSIRVDTRIKRKKIKDYGQVRKTISYTKGRFRNYHTTKTELEKSFENDLGIDGSQPPHPKSTPHGAIPDAIQPAFSTGGLNVARYGNGKRPQDREGAEKIGYEGSEPNDQKLKFEHVGTALGGLGINPKSAAPNYPRVDPRITVKGLSQLPTTHEKRDSPWYKRTVVKTAAAVAAMLGGAYILSTVIMGGSSRSNQSLEAKTLAEDSERPKIERPYETSESATQGKTPNGTSFYLAQIPEGIDHEFLGTQRTKPLKQPASQPTSLESSTQKDAYTTDPKQTKTETKDEESSPVNIAYPEHPAAVESPTLKQEVGRLNKSTHTSFPINNPPPADVMPYGTINDSKEESPASQQTKFKKPKQDLVKLAEEALSETAPDSQPTETQSPYSHLTPSDEAYFKAPGFQPRENNPILREIFENPITNFVIGKHFDDQVKQRELNEATHIKRGHEVLNRLYELSQSGDISMSYKKVPLNLDGERDLHANIWSFSSPIREAITPDHSIAHSPEIGGRHSKQIVIYGDSKDNPHNRSEGPISKGPISNIGNANWNHSSTAQPTLLDRGEIDTIMDTLGQKSMRDHVLIMSKNSGGETYLITIPRKYITETSTNEGGLSAIVLEGMGDNFLSSQEVNWKAPLEFMENCVIMGGTIYGVVQLGNGTEALIPMGPSGGQGGGGPGLH